MTVDPERLSNTKSILIHFTVDGGERGCVAILIHFTLDGGERGCVAMASSTRGRRDPDVDFPSIGMNKSIKEIEIKITF